MRHPGVRWALASLAVVCTLVSAVSILGIWIYFFDNEGGEPGAATIFGSIPFWPLVPLVPLVAIAAAVVSYRRLWFFLIVAGLTLALLAGAVVTTMLTRAANAEKRQMLIMHESRGYIATGDAVPELK